MSKLLPRARGYLADVTRGFERAPLEMALALYLAVTDSIAIELDAEGMPSWLELAVPALLILAVAWTGTLLHALGVWRQRTRWLVVAIAAVVILVYAVFVLDFSRAAEGWRAAALVGAAVLWLVAVPALGERTDPVARMRLVDGRIVLRTIAVLLYGAALYLGLTLALAAINALFELHLEGKIYLHVFGWIFLVLVPWVIFGGLDDYVRPAGGPDAVASAVQRLTLYLVPPLLTLYFLILYAYMVRIAVTGEVPKNLVSPMVLAAGALTGVALLLFDPHPRGAAFERGLRLSPALLLPLIPLGAWALMARLGQYGWTEFRALRLVLLGAFTALALLATIQLWRRRPFALHVLPLTLAAALVLAVIGPWSVLPLSRRDQRARLEQALAQVARVPADTAGRLVAAELYDRVQNDARYLQIHFGTDALPLQLRQYAQSTRWVNYAEAMGLRRAPSAGSPEKNMYRSLPVNIPVAVSGATLYRIQYARDPGRRQRASTLLSSDSLSLIIHLPMGVLQADLAPLLTGPAGPGNELTPAASIVAVRDAAGLEHGQLVVFDASAARPERKLVLQHLEGVLVLRPPR